MDVTEDRRGPRDWESYSLYLIDGDFRKGARWCLARSHQRAFTVYRNIHVPDAGLQTTPRGTPLRKVARVKIEDDGELKPGQAIRLSGDQIYWHREPGFPSFSGAVRDLAFEHQALVSRR